jgi:uncharacterized protein (DUF362 family)
LAKAGEIQSPFKGPQEELNRRQFLKVGASGLVGASAFGAGALWTYDRENRIAREKTVGLVRDYTIPDDPKYPQVVQIQGSDPQQTLTRAMELLGGVSRFVERGDRVAIKPNIGWDRAPRHAANTNPDLVAVMVELCLKAGASEVIVTDASCNDANRAYKRSGIGQAAYNAGARVFLPRADRFRDLALDGRLLKKWPVYTPLVFADKFINMAICKHHNLTAMTGVMKNLYGILGGQRNLLHQDIHTSIFDLGNFLRPTLVVLDAFRVLVRNGPQGGSFSDTEERNLLVVGTDQVAIDAISARILGNDPMSIGYLKMSDGILGHVDLNKIRFKEA